MEWDMERSGGEEKGSDMRVARREGEEKYELNTNFFFFLINTHPTHIYYAYI
jgi:hypothetical protein